MLEIEVWMKCFTEKLRAAFGEKLEFIGLQGSYGRGEATESSDIDVVVIFSELAMSDLERYKDLIGEMTYNSKSSQKTCLNGRAGLSKILKYKGRKIQSG